MEIVIAMKILAIYQQAEAQRPDLHGDIKALRETDEVRELPFRRLADILGFQKG